MAFHRNWSILHFLLEIAFLIWPQTKESRDVISDDSFNLISVPALSCHWSTSKQMINKQVYCPVERPDGELSKEAMVQQFQVVFTRNLFKQWMNVRKLLLRATPSSYLLLGLHNIYQMLLPVGHWKKITFFLLLDSVLKELSFMLLLKVIRIDIWKDFQHFSLDCWMHIFQNETCIFSASRSYGLNKNLVLTKLNVIFSFFSYLVTILNTLFISREEIWKFAT